MTFNIYIYMYIFPPLVLLYEWMVGGGRKANELRAHTHANNTHTMMTHIGLESLTIPG
jgi:hypothetical protein